MSENEKTITKPGWKAMVFRILFFLLGNMVIVAGLWQQEHFKGISIAAMVFQIQVPMVGADQGIFTTLFVDLAVKAPFFTAIQILLGILWRRLTTKCRFLHEHIVLPAVIWFAGATIAVCAIIGVFGYLRLIIRPSHIYEDYYVDPATVSVKAPEKPRNLIYIYLESMEVTFADESVGGAADGNRIPFLTKLALTEGESFSTDGKLNGLYPVEGAVMTSGSIVAQMTGVPLIVSVKPNAMGRYTSFLDGAYSIGQVLEKFGYQNLFMQGSQIQFAGKDRFFASHGDYQIRDYTYYNEHQRLPYFWYNVWWGFEDFRLYEFAKEEILTAATADKPFVASILTVDTHCMDGYICPLCGDEYEEQYDNVFRCADRQVEEFITWLQAQDFYENTTVIIVGDHPTMDSRYYSVLSHGNESYQRKAYTVILNSAVEYKLNKTRKYSALDMYPTTLAAMGFEIPGNKLGLGVNLYSDEETLVERMGLEKLNKELLKHSKYYNKHIIEGK